MAPASLEAPDAAFLVLSAEAEDENGQKSRGSKLLPLERGQDPPPEWRLRDFAFAAFKGPSPGLREVHFGRRSVWVFASPREHCEEVVIFRRSSDVRPRWDGEAIHEPKVGLDKFFIMRMSQLTKDTPLSKQFAGEWGFWESFFVPILDDEEHSLDKLASMDALLLETYFQHRKLAVTCHRCPPSCQVLTIPQELVVRRKLEATCTDMDEWADFLNKIGNDLVLQFSCTLSGNIIKDGSECVKAVSKVEGEFEGSRLKKRDLEALRLPVTLSFECDLNVVQEFKPDTLYLQKKFEALGQAYESNLMNGFSALGRLRPDPWNPMSRLAASALSQVLARVGNIRTMMDVGCGDMSWMQYVVHEHPEVTYVGVDIVPYCLAVNFRRFPKMQFIQTDLSNSSGIEVLPQGVDLVIAKEVFNQMILPDAVEALRRVLNTRPRFLLTHIDTACDNRGWEARIGQHLEYTSYDYNKPPFSLPYPVVHIQRISETAAYVLYQVTEPNKGPSKPLVMAQDLQLPELPLDLEEYATIMDGEQTSPEAFGLVGVPGDVVKGPADDLGPKPVRAESENATAAGKSVSAPAEAPKPIKGVPAAEFRARCDLIFEKFDKDHDNFLNFEELANLMAAGGRRIEEYEAYSALCGRLGCDARVGLGRKDTYKLFEKAPQSVWEEVYRSINPLAQMVKKGAARLPEAFLERPLPNFLFDDGEDRAKVIIDVNDHLYFGASDVVTADRVQAFFGKQRLEVHIACPGSYEAKDLYLWKLVVTPLAGEIVPEDCTMELKDASDRAGMRCTRIVIRLVKSKRKKWGKVGQAATGQRV